MQLHLMRALAILLIGFAFPAAAHADRWEDLMHAGIAAFKDGNYGAAESSNKAALHEAEKFGPDDPRLAASLNALGFVYYTQGDHEAAEPFYKRSLAIRERALGADHPVVSTSVNNLALLYLAEGDHGAAEAFFKRCVTISEKAPRSDHPVLVRCLENYAVFLREAGRADEAVELELGAVAIHKTHR
jgi:tetratricopeptide (TPR) repeat protein